MGMKTLLSLKYALGNMPINLWCYLYVKLLTVSFKIGSICKHRESKLQFKGLVQHFGKLLCFL